MRTGRSYVATAIAIGAITLSGCAADGPAAGGKSEEHEDWGDESAYPELGGKFAGLTAFSGTCAVANGVMTVTATAGADQTIIIGKRAVDSAILVNGAVVSGCSGVTGSTLKQLKVVATTNDQTVILDFLGGTFAPGIATARGITVDLGAGTADEVRIRGTSGNDSWVFGSDGLAYNTDAFRDIDFTGVEKLNFAMAGGNDVLTGTVVPAGLGAGKGVSASATLGFTVFGGAGNDTVTGGTKSDKIYGGPGSDILAGGGDGSGGEVDNLYGEAGADTITQGDANNGKDNIHCGTEASPDPDAPVVDTLTYALRGTAAVRDNTSGATKLATDGERVQLFVGGIDPTETVPGTLDADTNADGVPDADADADGYPDYYGNSGHSTENYGTGVLTMVENDAINPDCEVVMGSQDNDILVGNVLANTLSGGVGDDNLTGGLGDDVLNGDDGADTFDEKNVDTGSDVFNGGAGTDTVDYSARAALVLVTMDGADADDGLAGEEDNVGATVENLIGTAYADEIHGNALDNVLTGGLGADKLYGEAGNDTFYEGLVTNNGDEFHGGAGVDTVDYSKRYLGVWVTMGDETANDGQGTLPVRVVNTGVTVLALAGTATTGTTSEGDNVDVDVENVNGSMVADDIRGNDLNNSIDGGPGADFLFGGLGDDTLFGGAAVTADETVYSVDLSQPTDGDSTDTAVVMAEGDDYLYGEGGNDILDAGGDTENKVVCGEGEDIGYNQGSVTWDPTTGAGAFRDATSCES